MKNTYINGVGCISSQKIYDTIFLEEAKYNQNDTFLAAIAPDYREFISPASARRMAKGAKNGIVASFIALKDANIKNIDAIITGTGQGCVEDSEKFLKNIIDNDEKFLTPTSFIQSTHNTVGAQVALVLSCNGYNFTYVNGSVSFESALLDAKMLIEENQANTVLVGGVDEMTDYILKLYKLAGRVKKESEKPFEVLEAKSGGVVYGEGACFFVLGKEKNENTYANILDIETTNLLQNKEIEGFIINFLKTNGLQISDIDAVVMGFNGDINSDIYYKNISENILAKTPQLYYKHLSGEYDTASAFALWMVAKIIKTQEIPQIIKVNTVTRKVYNTILLYNQVNGKNHSVILISK